MTLRANSRRCVLDANALIGFFGNRPGAATNVRHLMEKGFRKDLPLLLSAGNWGEVGYMAWRRGSAKARETEIRLRPLPIVGIAADHERATRAAALKQKHNLGYADAFAAELALERGAWLVTADSEFARVGKELAVFSLPQYEK